MNPYFEMKDLVEDRSFLLICCVLLSLFESFWKARHILSELYCWQQWLKDIEKRQFQSLWATSNHFLSFLLKYSCIGNIHGSFIGFDWNFKTGPLIF